MRFLKRILIAVLIFEAAYLVALAVLQSCTGYDYTAAYAVGGAGASVELILCSLIKRAEKDPEQSDDVKDLTPVDAAERIKKFNEFEKERDDGDL